MPLDNKGKFPTRHEISRAVSSFNIKQKTVLFGISIIFIFGLLGILWKLNSYFLVDVAVPGGTLTEGIVSVPSHANPLLAITDADRDVAALVYSGLMKVNAAGELIPDLAESYNISDDGLIYDFTLKKDLEWQDGAPLTTNDVEFTIKKAQDSTLASPRRASWEGVKVEKINNTQIRFILKKPYAGFLENATLGILPEHIWKSVKTEAFPLSDYNVKGIGSGPFKIESVSRDLNGLPDTYTLSPFAKYALGEPKISSLVLRFYENEEKLLTAYKRGEIESFNSISPDQAEKLKQNGANFRQISLPRSFAVFFNQSNSVLNDPNIRAALTLATDKKLLVNNVLKGAGTPIDHPIPPGSIGYINQQDKPNPAQAIKILEKAGWTKDSDGVLSITDKKKKTVRLEFSLATANAPELKASAQLLADEWAKIGVKANVSVYDLADLDQGLIRPRKFDALLFGEVLGRNPDPYAFWHSSQRLAPGLNISQYTNSTVDELLEEARHLTSETTRAEKFKKFQLELAKDQPAIFLYSPYFLYALPSKVKGAEFPSLLIPSDRFLTIQNWYIHQDKVWKIFTFKF